MRTSISRVLVFCLVLSGMAFAVPQEAEAQRWLQTSQLITDVENDGPARALLDTLVQVAERRDNVEFRRSRDADETMTLSTLRDQLIDGPGIGLTSANKVFIDYRFEIDNQGFQESIQGLQFIFRPATGNEEDVQMMYLDASDPWIRTVLNKKGTTLTTNEVALRTFKDQLAFARIVRNAQIVEIAGDPVREGFEAKKRSLVQKIQRLTYESM